MRTIIFWVQAFRLEMERQLKARFDLSFCRISSLLLPRQRQRNLYLRHKEGNRYPLPLNQYQAKKSSSLLESLSGSPIFDNLILKCLSKKYSWSRINRL